MIVAHALLFVHWPAWLTWTAAGVLIPVIFTILRSIRERRNARRKRAIDLIVNRCWRLQWECQQWVIRENERLDLQVNEARDPNDDPSLFEEAWAHFVRERATRR